MIPGPCIVASRERSTLTPYALIPHLEHVARLFPEMNVLVHHLVELLHGLDPLVFDGDPNRQIAIRVVGVPRQAGDALERPRPGDAAPVGANSCPSPV